MLYLAYQTQSDVMEPVRAMARIARSMLEASPIPGFADNLVVRNWIAAYSLVERMHLSHTRPPFEVGPIQVQNELVEVEEEEVFSTPFATLLHFKKDVSVAQPVVLVVAPMSGHFATLLRGTVRTLLADNDVYITDWHNARDVDASAGRFGFDEYVDHVIQFLEFLGPGNHVVGVCQPCVQVLAAVAVMAASGNEAQPRSMTLMAGPIDARIAPTRVDILATDKPIEWFEETLIDRVPSRFPGGGRRVYPGFLQLAAFVSMNLDRHVRSHLDLFDDLAKGETTKAATTKAFYDEYFAVLDLHAEFYLETVKKVFQDHELARGVLEWRGKKIDTHAITRTALLTVEGERDDICSVGQTLAAHDLCSGIRPYLKRHHMQPGVGHYGVFSGRRWESQIYPLVRNLILSTSL